jgi:hypothetical protein
MLSNALLVAIIALGSDPAFGADVSDKIILYVDKTKGCSKENELASNTRAMHTEGDVLTYYFDPNNVSGDVQFIETKRDTVLLTQLKALVSAVTNKQKGALLPECSLQEVTYTLKFKRSNLKIIAKSIDEKSEKDFVVVTGPKENWYLGFDLPINSNKTLKYDQATKSLLPQDQNPQLYLSFNYSFSDVALTSSPKNNTWSLKLLLLASSRPLDSYGLGIGYRLPEVTGVVDLSSFSLFAGRFWYKQDSIAGGVGQLNQSTGKDWRVGITYDFSTGLPWIK